jgi:polyphosphate kinase
MNDLNYDNPDYFINRELSQIQFVKRVLDLALDNSLPLLERLVFLFISSQLLDEFFEVRVAHIKEIHAAGLQKTGADGMRPAEVLSQISEQAHDITQSIYDTLNQHLMPALSKENVYFVTPDKWNKATEAWVEHHFTNEILPLLSPIGLDLAHPFPRLVNKSLNFIVSLEGKDAFDRDTNMAVVHAPRALPRAIKLPPELHKKGDAFILLTSVIQAHIDVLFPGMSITGCYQFRLTRNSDLFVDEEAVEDLASAVKTELLARRYGSAVRLEIAADCPEAISSFLLAQHALTESDLYHCQGPVNLGRYIAVLDLLDRPELRYPVLEPQLPERLAYSKDMFKAINKQDILLHHPYQSFHAVVNFIRQATADPNVLAIKQTLYRTRAESAMVQALIEAARAGKEVTAVIEVRARFDEESNINLANELQEAGALVVYGVVGFKTHAKMILVVRREKDRLRRYVHLGTGNYHERTALRYTDFGFLTSDPILTHDVQLLFQQLTGVGKATPLKKLLPSPFSLSDKLHELIEYEIKQARRGKKAVIIAKMNGLSDPKMIKALYRASEAGVKIDLIVRSICCLRPGVPGVSNNIRVRSIVGRFLEHSRVYYFYHGGKESLFGASADWMERNLYHRVEACFPIEDPELKARLKKEGCEIYLKDNADAWQLKSNGQYQKVRSKSGIGSAQQWLLDWFGR